MGSSTDQLLALARRQITATKESNGHVAALTLLERGVADKHDDTAHDERVWACIAYLRSKKGDQQGAKQAREMAYQLRSTKPKQLSFQSSGTPKPTTTSCFSNQSDINRKDITKTTNDGNRNREIEKSIEKSKILNKKTTELLKQVGINLESTNDVSQQRTEMLITRSKYLRQITANILQAAKETNALG